MLLNVLNEAELMPQAWLHYPISAYSFFNPAITRFQDQYLMAYRVALGDERRLALCRLSPEMRVVPDSVVPLSDFIQPSGNWQADARFCIFRDRLFIHYNDGSRKKPNHIYLVEIDPDTLRPRGPARELLLDGPRRIVEKNWMLFAHDDELWAIYAISPHIVLRLAWDETAPLLCHIAYQQAWNNLPYPAHFGEPRGGAPPVRLGDQYISFFHSSFPVRPLRRLLFRALRKPADKMLRYVGGVYGFAAEPPFAPRWCRPAPLILPPTLPRRQRDQLDQRIERSAYPCGAILQEQNWIVSFGAQEEYCCLAKLTVDTIYHHSVINPQAVMTGTVKNSTRSDCNRRKQ